MDILDKQIAFTVLCRALGHPMKYRIGLTTQELKRLIDAHETWRANANI